MANSNPSIDCTVIASMAYVVDPSKKRGNSKQPYLVELTGDALMMSAMEQMSAKGCLIPRPR